MNIEEMTPTQKRQYFAEVTADLARIAPKITLTSQEDDLVEDYLEGYLINEKNRWYRTHKDATREYKPFSDIKQNVMHHQIACEVGVCELLDIDYLPRHEWHERKEIGVMRRDTCALMFDTEVRVEMRIKEGAKGVYINKDDITYERIVVWGEVRLVECECLLCNDAPARPETRVRILGAVRATQDLWNSTDPQITHKKRKITSHFVPAHLILSAYEFKDDDGFPLVSLD
jgi:hypothetical protein